MEEDGESEFSGNWGLSSLERSEDEGNLWGFVESWSLRIWEVKRV